jgi:hypothetical protein
VRKIEFPQVRKWIVPFAVADIVRIHALLAGQAYPTFKDLVSRA